VDGEAISTSSGGDLFARGGGGGGDEPIRGEAATVGDSPVPGEVSWSVGIPLLPWVRLQPTGASALLSPSARCGLGEGAVVELDRMPDVGPPGQM
jgi:hypothetical protein